MIQGVLTNIRAIELDDVPSVHRWFNSPEVMMGWGNGVAVVSRTVVAEQIAGWIDQERTALRPVAFIIEPAVDSAPIGLLIANPVDPERRVAQLSLLIGDPDEWGLGFGGDALDAFLDAAFNGWNLLRIELEVEAGNVRAERLYARAGFQQEALLRKHRFINGERTDVLFMGLTDADWRSRQPLGGQEHRAQHPDERFDVLHATGEPAGFAKPRWLVHRDGDWHRSIHVWICGVDEHGPFLDFQQRGREKDTWPGMLDATIGGHLAAGEELIEAYREIEEEAGITVSHGQLVHFGTRRGINEQGAHLRDREIQEVHFLRRDAALETYEPNPDEVAGFVRMQLAELIDLLSGERARLVATCVRPGTAFIEAIEVGISDFIPSIDRYFLRVALACSSFIAGETRVVV
jgi:RimJ/RimL family protein N-acetyltransferase/isopentenyldiphosphate isomerase